MQIVVSLFAIGVLTAAPSAFQSPGSTGQPAIRACSLLPKELAAKVTPHRPEIFDLVPPMEDALGNTGSACSYAGITLQIDPFMPSRLDALYKERGKNWVPVPDVGDAAYFFDNRGEYAELYGRVGAHVFTIQMDVPEGSTAEAIKPKVIALANAIVPKLK